MTSPDSRKPPGKPPATTSRWPLSLDRLATPTRRLVEPGTDRAIDRPDASQAVPTALAAAAARARSGERARPASADAQTLRPQRMLSDAAREAALARPVQGQGLDTLAFRRHMVERLQHMGCRDPGVLAALTAVPRHEFVDSALVGQAYEDTSLPIGLGQTISKPSVVARMIELMRARPGGPGLTRVLEIGTGCGYQAAVLAQVAERVVSIERLKGLHDKARLNLAPLGLRHLQLIYGDGMLGHAPAAPYDGIIAAAGGHELPPAWLDQLARGGRLVAPVHDAALQTQVLMVVDKLADGSIIQRVHETVRFVPLESGLSEFGPT